MVQAFPVSKRGDSGHTRHDENYFLFLTSLSLYFPYIHPAPIYPVYPLSTLITWVV